MIITKLLSSCVIQTYVTNPASQEMPWKRSKYKTSPPSTVWQLKLCSSPSAFPLGDFFPSVVHESQQPGCSENKGPIVHLLGSDAKYESRLLQPEAKEEMRYIQPLISWNRDATNTVISSGYMKPVQA